MRVHIGDDLRQIAVGGAQILLAEPAQVVSGALLHMTVREPDVRMVRMDQMQPYEISPAIVDETALQSPLDIGLRLAIHRIPQPEEFRGHFHTAKPGVRPVARIAGLGGILNPEQVDGSPLAVVVFRHVPVIVVCRALHDGRPLDVEAIGGPIIAAPHPAVVVHTVKRHGQAALFQIVFTGYVPRALLRRLQRWQKQGHENCDHRHNDE